MIQSTSSQHHPTSQSPDVDHAYHSVSSSTMSQSIADFHIADYIVFALFLVVSLVIGLYHACHCITGKGRLKTVNDFLVADRRLSTLPVAISMFVSLVSGVLVLGHPAEVYTRGVQFLIRSVGHVIAGLIAAAVFVPLFFRLRLTSAFEVCGVVLAIVDARTVTWS